MIDQGDEFRFLTSDARRVGRTSPLPEVRRASVPVSQGLRLSALAFAPDRAPEYVFLHGMGLNAHGFDPVVFALDSPALSLDLPGHGHSDWREDANYRPDLLAADVLLALQELAPGPFTLVGHSLGGLTAALVATGLGARLRALVLVDITPGIGPQRDAGAISDFISGQREFASQEEMVDRAIAFGIGEDRDALTRGVALNSRRRADGRWEWAHHFAHMDTAPAESFGDEAPFAPLWQPLEALHANGTPTSLVRASDGLVDAGLVAEWRERLPGSSVSTVDGPHNLHEASPAALAEALRES